MDNALSNTKVDIFLQIDVIFLKTTIFDSYLPNGKSLKYEQ